MKLTPFPLLRCGKRDAKVRSILSARHDGPRKTKVTNRLLALIVAFFGLLRSQGAKPEAVDCMGAAPALRKVEYL